MQLSPGQDLSDSYLQKFIDALKYSPEDLETIEILTRGQSDNKLWNEYRKGLITGSLIHEIHTRMKSVQAGQAHDASRLINKCLGNDRFTGNNNTAYGLANEDIAAAQYRDIISQSHCNFKLTECGLLLSETYGFIGGSVDRIASCSCHSNKTIVEIKCPSSLEKCPKGTFSSFDWLVCRNSLEEDTKELELKKNHRFYSQVMLHGSYSHKGVSFCYLVPSGYLSFNHSL